MTKVQKSAKAIFNNLIVADKRLREAMTMAGSANMILVTNDIRDAEFHLDDALARVEAVIEEKSKSI